MLAGSSKSRADIESTPTKWRGAVSLGVGVTALKDENPAHLMTDEFLGLFGGYQFHQWVLGPVFDVRLMQQQSALSSVGGTNFAGTGFTWGLGVLNDFTPKFSLQTAFLLGGEHYFTRQTYAAQDARLSRPVGIEIKPQYFYSEGKSHSIDLDLRFVQWRDFITPSGGVSKTLSEVSVGLVFSFHFPTLSNIPQPSNPPSMPTPIEPPSQQPVAPSQIINLSGSLFKTGSAELDDEEARQKILRAAATFARNPNSRIRIEGHTDSVGKEQKNLHLSQARAESIKAIFVEGGVSADRITAQGYGMSKPVSDNATSAGRSQNRRVEIYIDEK